MIARTNRDLVAADFGRITAHPAYAGNRIIVLGGRINF